MKSKSGKSRILVSLLLLVTLVFSQIPADYAAENNTKDSGYDYNCYSNSTGLKEPTEEGLKWIEENMIKTKEVKLNGLGLERINKERKIKKLEALRDDIAVEEGKEVEGESNLLSSEKNINVPTDSTYSLLTASELPDYIDNSTLAAFPSIRSQGDISSCVAFATTYYQMTYMVARSKGWNAKDDTDNTTKLSPKWTYNFINGGNDNGSDQSSAYRLLSQNGAALWSDFPYSGDKLNSKNYLEWPTQSSVYKNAMKYRADKMGYIPLVNGDGTLVTSPDDSDLSSIKTMLTNGYVLSISTNIYSWRTKEVNDDPGTANDTQFVGQQACYMVDGYEGSHAMVIVGYNDDIWVDLNNNNMVDSGEKGAFKIANSWGTSWGNNGYIWMCYDALNSISSVIGGPSAEMRTVAFSDLYWITVKQAYTPKFIAEFTLSHSSRNQISTYVGFSNSTDTNPALIWKPMAFGDNLGGNYAFDGTTTPCDATVALDITDISSDNISNSDGNWYLSVKDTFSDGKSTVLKNFKLIDNENGTSINSTAVYPQICDGQAVMNILYSTRTVNTQSNWTIYNSLPFERYSLACAAVDNNIFVFGNNDEINSVMTYNLQTGLWSSKENAYPSYHFTGAVALGNKIYVMGTSDFLQSILFEYNPATDTWITKYTVPYRMYTSLVSANNKIYIIGGSPEYDMVSEYNPQTGIMSAKTNIPARLADAGIASVDNKIYVMGGTDQNNYTPTNSVYVFDTVSGIWSTKSTMPAVKSNIKAEAIEGKIYIFGGTTENYSYSTSIEEYNPASEIWTQDKSSMIYKLSGYYLTKLDNQIYLLGGRNDWEQSKLLAGFSLGSTTTPTPPTTTTSSVTPTPTGSATPTPTATNNVTPTPTPTQNGNLKVEFFNSNKSAQVNQISTNIRITNLGTTPVNLADVIVRYYYTIDGEKTQSFWCDYSNIASTKITANYVKLDAPVSNADYYIEIGFTNDAGNLAAGSFVDINARVAKNDWSNYTQSNDYSFNAQAASFVSWDKTPAYISGSKVWGIEP